jgi:hypothetical protein
MCRAGPAIPAKGAPLYAIVSDYLVQICHLFRVRVAGATPATLVADCGRIIAKLPHSRQLKPLPIKSRNLGASHFKLYNASPRHVMGPDANTRVQSQAGCQKNIPDALPSKVLFKVSQSLVKLHGSQQCDRIYRHVTRGGPCRCQNALALRCSRRPLSLRSLRL